MPRLQLGAKISARTEEGVNARSTARRFPLSRHWFGASSNDEIMLRRVGLRRRDTGLAPSSWAWERRRACTTFQSGHCHDSELAPSNKL